MMPVVASYGAIRCKRGCLTAYRKAYFGFAINYSKKIIFSSGYKNLFVANISGVNPEFSSAAATMIGFWKCYGAGGGVVGVGKF